MSYLDVNLHIVFAEKRRRNMLIESTMARLVKYTGGIIRKLKGCLYEANGTDNHLHILCSISSQASIADLLREIKTNTSAWLHREYPDLHDFAWQDGYSAFSVSHSALPRVKEYIQNQRKRHQEQSFQNELKILLEKHGISYDPKFL